MLKVRNRVLVISTVDVRPHRCVVETIGGGDEGDWFQVRCVTTDRRFGRRLAQEDFDWARGWASPAAKALLAQLALENSR